MASLAGMLKQRGFRVTGSDAAAYPPMSDFLAALGIPVAQPFDPRNLEPAPDLVVVGNAISRGNVELEHVLDQRIPFCSLPQFLHDEFLRGKEVLVVAGTHGKTTTTSMLAWIFHTAGLQPSFLIGGIAENFGTSFHLGQGKHFILEGDEYDTAFFDKGPKFLHYFPDAVILTSVEFDHADIYKDLDAVETAFKRLVNLIPRRGRIVAFDGAAGDARERQPGTLSGQGVLPGGAIRRRRARAVANHQPEVGARRELHGRCLRDGRPWADFEFALAGEYNVWNATAAAALAAAYGISKEEIAAALKTFKSVKRRLEVKAQVNGITIIDDFAHHPTAIAGTLKALRARYAGARLWAILEPRSNTLRRRVLQAIWRAAWRWPTKSWWRASSGRRRYRKTSGWTCRNWRRRLRSMASRARLFADADEIVQTIAPEMRSGDVVAILSNGGFGGIYEKLPARLQCTRGRRCFHQFRECGRGCDDRLPLAARAAARFICLLRLRVCICSDGRCWRPCYAVTNYTVSLAQPEQHLVEVQIHAARRRRGARIAAAGVECAVSGSRLRPIRQLGARQRSRRSAARRARNSIRAGGRSRGTESGAIVEYQIFVDSSGPFGAQLNPHHAFFNLAEILMYPVDARSHAVDVRFNQIPDGWHIATPLSSPPRWRFSADNYDRLVDSPVEIGTFQESDFDEGGGHYRVIVDADPGDYDMEKIVAMLRNIVAAATSWMDDRPFETYMFLYHFPRGPAGGGMEHAYSTAIDVNADVLARTRRGAGLCNRA